MKLTRFGKVLLGAALFVGFVWLTNQGPVVTAVALALFVPVLIAVCIGSLIVRAPGAIKRRNARSLVAAQSHAAQLEYYRRANAACNFSLRNDA